MSGFLKPENLTAIYCLFGSVILLRRTSTRSFRYINIGLGNIRFILKSQSNSPKYHYIGARKLNQVIYRRLSLKKKSARNLGVVFENGLTFEKHISYICKLAFYHLRRIAKIRSYLSEESTIALIHAFITCRLDNGNALLYGLPKYQIQRLQSVQNCAARLVKRYPKFGHTSPLLSVLHWLPVEHRIVFKILLLVFKSLNNLAPSYISDLLTPYVIQSVSSGCPKVNSKVLW